LHLREGKTAKHWPEFPCYDDVEERIKRRGKERDEQRIAAIWTKVGGKKEGKGTDRRNATGRRNASKEPMPDKCRG